MKIWQAEIFQSVQISKMKKVSSSSLPYIGEDDETFFRKRNLSYT